MMSTRPGRVWVAGLAVALVASMATLALAQDRRGGGRGRLGLGRAAEGLTLLRFEVVRKELKVTDEQAEALRELREEQQDGRREFFQSLRDLSREEREDKIAAYRAKTDKAIAKVLKPEQLERLGQIEIQQAGPSILTQAKYAKVLKVTKEQQEKIREIQDDSRAAQRELFAELRDVGGDRAAIGEKLTAMREKVNQQILGVLTADQREAFDKLKGKPVDVPRRQGRGRRRDNA